MTSWVLINSSLLCLTIYLNFLKKESRRFSYTIIVLLLSMPTLAVEYIFFSTHYSFSIFPYILLSEFVFCYIFFLAINRLHYASAQKQETSPNSIILSSIGLGILALTLYVNIFTPITNKTGSLLISNLFHYGAVFCLITVLNTAWKAENFWGTLTSNQRWQYKFFILGVFITSGSLGWIFSYRLMYPLIKGQHLMLLAALLFLSFAMMLYALARHRLLNRKIFIARQVIYSFAAPSLLAGYLVCLGTLAYVSKHFGYEINFVLFWFAVICGFVLCAALVLSGRVRQRVKYFISTNFYNNKYEYRDEWLAFSSLLKGELSERGVASALNQVLTDCLYTTEIIIWLGDKNKGYLPVSTDNSQNDDLSSFILQSKDPLLLLLEENNFLYTKDTSPDPTLLELLHQKNNFLISSQLELFIPMTIGRQMVGLIGLGPEYTGGHYGPDDFDLLAALSTQAASTILSVRMAEKLAKVREKEAIATLSAFVLHDIKNAAAMLSLVQANAPEHIDNPEFQQDMLETIDDALKRMNKVQKKMANLKGDQKPDLQNLDINSFIKKFGTKMSAKLAPLAIECDCPETVTLETDVAMLESIMENILLNGFEAEANTIRVIVARDIKNQRLTIEIIDDGQGISLDLLPDRLFSPFVSGKAGGSGIGLWQVKQLVKQLDGRIMAANAISGGSVFTIQLPVHP